MVDFEINDRVGFITLNRPEKRNALSFEMVDALSAAFDQAENSPDVKVVVLRSTGSVFCSGADLAMLQNLQRFTREENLADSEHLAALFLKIYTLKKIVIAQVQGHALAGGCGLATVCDFVYAVPEARFGYTEVKIGFIPAIVMVFLIRKIGEQKAKRLLLTGDLVTAEIAKSMDLVDEVIQKEMLHESVVAFAQRLIKNNSTNSMMMTKSMISKVQDMPLEAALSFASQKNVEARESQDCKAGIQAFLDKKDIVW